MSVHIRRITATGGRGLLGLGAIWQYRELLYLLTWRDIKVRYTQAVLGIAWALLQPLTLILFFTLFFSRIPGVGSDNIPYPLFACCGLVPWQLFSSSVTSSNESVVANERIITKVYFPRVLLPLAAVLTATIDFIIAFVLLIVLMIAFRVTPDATIIALPLFVLLALMISFGAGIWLAALNAQYRDFRYVTPFLVQAWLFATPVVFSSHSLSPALQSFLALNPMTAVVEGFRWVMLNGTPPSLQSVVTSSILALVLLITGLVYFARIDDRLADII